MATPRLRPYLWWWRRWTKKDWAIAAVGFTALVFVFSFLFDASTPDDSPTARSFTLTATTTAAADLVDLTLLKNAKDKGALCLDGSVPGYHFQKGFGSGSDNWLLHIEGGGWCHSVESCSDRARTALGSSKYMDHQTSFSGMLSRDSSRNPDFYNWNKVKIRYCDGASFAGHPESENGTGLYFRGQLIWESLMEELLSKGLSNAKQAFLTGCSAGGLATLIHCDDFQSRLRKDATVKCLADAGFFLNEKDISGSYIMAAFYQNVVRLQGVHKSLPKDCITRMEPLKCLFPKELVKSIKTPLFIVNPAYDFWQIQHVLVSNGDSDWKTCRLAIHACNHSQIEILQGFRSSLLKSLSNFQSRKNAGMFINSCFVHCQTWMDETWNSHMSPRINNKTIAESVGDWFFNRKEAQHIDCPYPCNPTCINMDFTHH